MQTITVKYLGPTNTKPSRLKATASNGAYAIVPYNLPEETSDYAGYNRAAKLLRDRMGWIGKMIGGQLQGSEVVYVFVDGPTAYWIGET